MVKNLPAKAGDIREAGSVSGSGRSPGGGNGNLLQYSCQRNPMMNRGAWWATVRGVPNSQTQLSEENKPTNDLIRVSWVKFHKLSS